MQDPMRQLKQAAEQILCEALTKNLPGHRVRIDDVDVHFTIVPDTGNTPPRNVILAKVESTYGVDPTPTLASNAIIAPRKNKVSKNEKPKKAKPVSGDLAELKKIRTQLAKYGRAGVLSDEQQTALQEIGKTRNTHLSDAQKDQIKGIYSDIQKELAE